MSSRAVRCPFGSAAFGAGVLLLLAAIDVGATPSLANGWPDRVSAKYKVTFNGFDVGSFHFESTVNSRSYTTKGTAELSALLGVFKWSGTTQSSGRLTGEEPKPAEYDFDFKSKSKNGSVQMSFNDGGVASAKVLPPSFPSKNTVPVQQHHLKGVLDPMSAILALSRGRVGNPCGRSVSIFDGKHRFDLVLSFQRQERVTEARPSGQPEIGYVCRVRYIPIAGHKNNDETRQMANSNGIEVALRPIPSANLLVPYRVTIPTVAGPAVLLSQRVEITTGTGQIALVH
jgi:hypothetical protein